MSVKQGDTITVTFQGTGTNGEGVGKYGEYTVFADFVLPGEQALCRVTYVKGNVLYAALLALVQPAGKDAPLKRAVPLCKHFGKCGGCQLQHMTYESQLAFKRQLVGDNLKKIGGAEADVLPVQGGEQWHYRNKISLPVRGKRGKVIIGMYRQNSHETVAVDDCPLCGNWTREVISAVGSYLNEMRVTPYDERTFSGEVRHVAARFVCGQLLVTLVSNGEWKHDLRPLARSLSERFDKFGLFVNVNRGHNNVILGKVTQHICGIAYITGKENGVVYRLSPNSFFQVNDGIKRKMYQHVRQILREDETEVLIDCFSGVGLLTAALVGEYDTYAIEIEPSAVADADKMKADNGISRLTNICGDVNVELPKLLQKQRGKKCAVVVDPPRKGLGEGICRALAEAAPQKVVYISCDSATLARDLKYLSRDYTVDLIQPYDMFPNTRHVETLVCLTRQKGK